MAKLGVECIYLDMQLKWVQSLKVHGHIFHFFFLFFNSIWRIVTVEKLEKKLKKKICETSVNP